jgi:eukaryotic-like serine/threonine-protein kinase
MTIPREGDRIGPFLLLSELGKGGSAPVWLAHEIYGTTVLRPVAVKLFSIAETGEEGDAARRKIATEGRLLSSVEHPNIVRFYSLVEDERRGLVGLSMEVAHGTSLDDRLVESDEPPSFDEVLRIGETIASALAAVHRAGLVHQDVKPANIVESGGAYKLVDFGVAGGLATGSPPAADVSPLPLPDTVAKGSKASSLPRFSGGTTHLHGPVGTVGYVDPQILGAGASPAPASDLYGLGATLYELLTGVVPAASEAGLSGRVLDGRARAPLVRTRRPEVPVALAEAVDRLVSPRRGPAADARPSSAERVAAELGRIRRELSGESRALPPESSGPFRGLLRFEATDRDVYFGRTAEIASTLELLRTKSFVTLIGPSGSGKSSLARAGIVPAIRDGALGFPSRWEAITVSPGRDPWRIFVDALRGESPPAGEGLDRETSPATLAEALAERVEREGVGLLLVVDQLEELAMLVGREHQESRRRAGELLALLAERVVPGVRVLGTVRGDLLEVLLGSSGLARAVFRGSVPISPLTELAWEEVLDESLSVYGYTIESARLAQEITEEVRAYASAMPLVQFALSRLWDRRDTTRKQITRTAWTALGGIRGALDRHADTTLARLVDGDPDAERDVRAVLLALTTLQGTRASRSRAELQLLLGRPTESVEGQATTAQAKRLQRLLDGLIEARLLVEEGERLSLAHEALLTEWGKLRGFLQEARRERLFASEVEQAAERHREQPEAALLLSGPRLEAALSVIASGRVPLSAEATLLVEESHAVVVRARRRRNLLGVALSLVAALSFLVAGLALWQAQRRERALEARISLLEHALSNGITRPK